VTIVTLNLPRATSALFGAFARRALNESASVRFCTTRLQIALHCNLRLFSADPRYVDEPGVSCREVLTDGLPHLSQSVSVGGN
jgi:hypothetical protein